MWWKKPYINRRDWMLENQAALKLSPIELVVLLMIDYCQVQNLTITLEILAVRSSLDEKQVDDTLQQLAQRGLVKIFVENHEVIFSIDGLFDEGILYEFVDQSIFQVFEVEFGRPLSQQELTILNTWLKTYTKDEILDGLQMAIIYQKFSMSYIHAVLANKRKENGYDHR